MGGFADWMFVFLFCSFCGLAAGLQITNIGVPSTASAGDTIRLTCSYELSGDDLYSLTWWRNDMMFFKYVSNHVPPVSVFNVPGITVDLEKSSVREVYLSHVDHRASGRMRCEVLSEYTYEKDAMDANITVVDMPSHGPSITTSPPHRRAYRAGDLLLLNCSSTYSYPPTTFTWDIDGHQVTTGTVVLYPGETDALGRKTSKSGLQMRLRQEHFRGGLVIVRCISTILHIYRRIAKITITDADQELTSPVESASTSGAGSPSHHWPRVLLLLLLLLLSLLGT